ncbi:YfhO family protein [Geobacter sp. DSM 9736]|uniref:YfhO family protein n=1 Tax=Geobacter sp. DSM 9736 TaxID=1277350 RepID=UPI000B5015CE|nr:YfhO family protein [Geobacter sp. DSM 9736]SNB46597.1 membrane protein YfhO [Geobacter sp. DSM 9736]
MTERKKDLAALTILLAVLVVYFHEILFTDKIIRAPDIINEYYWAVLDLSKRSFVDFFRFDFTADWDIYNNSGNTLEGGGTGGQFLFLPNLIYYFLQPPVSVAWFIVLHLFFGACGTYLCCRLIGVGALGSFLGGLIFAIAPENASLINAGHVLKIATISVAPWAFYFFEKGFQSRRALLFMTTGVVLAFQFWYSHWQIAYYTCLGIGVYGICRSIGIIVAGRERSARGVAKLVLLNLVTMFFFLSTVAIDLMPLANWSVSTNRGAESGANQGKGGLDREEAMSWSLPPEELASFVIPGFFGFSRQEAGENPPGIRSYYWGRMNFTQTTDYMGLLPWLLLPLPLIFRRDRYTWLALAAVAGGIIFSMGKYSLIYNFLFDYFPGVNRFRVPKMIMFLPVFGLAVLSARGIDLILDPDARKTGAFRKYLCGVTVLPLLLLGVMGIGMAGRERWIESFIEMLAQPTRYEQGPALVMQRWGNIIYETGAAAAVAALYGAAIFAISRRWIPAVAAPLVLVALYLADTGRVNYKFMFLVDVPKETKNYTTPAIEFLSQQSDMYRVLPVSSGPGPFSSKKIPVMFIPMPVQQKRWQDILDSFSFSSAIPDMLNVKYLVYEGRQYEQEKQHMGEKFVPVFRSPDGSEVVLENRAVLPKAWLVSSVLLPGDDRQTLGLMQHPEFDPRRMALVESPPPLPMASPEALQAIPPGEVKVTRYEDIRIDLTVKALQNTLLVLGEKYYRGWKASADGKDLEIYPVNHILRGVYLPPGEHQVVFRFDPQPYKIGKYLTFSSFLLFACMLVWELWRKRFRAAA